MTFQGWGTVVGLLSMLLVIIFVLGCVVYYIEHRRGRWLQDSVMCFWVTLAFLFIGVLFVLCLLATGLLFPLAEQ